MIACIPAYNEEKNIAKVIKYLKPYFDSIVVFDNNSSDLTKSIALKHGARVVGVKKQGKGFVLRSVISYCRVRKCDLFLIDGDDTYSTPNLKSFLEYYDFTRPDMLVGVRINGMSLFKRIGNSFLNYIFNLFYRTDYFDILSGFRIIKYDRLRFLKLKYSDFRCETELSIRTKNDLVLEFPISYVERRRSHLRPFRDGWLIFRLILSGLR